MKKGTFLTDEARDRLRYVRVPRGPVDLTPFPGATLVPAPDVVLPFFATDQDGHAVCDFVWPDFLPSGAEIFFQWWIVDPSTAFGYAISNAVSATGA